MLRTVLDALGRSIVKKALEWELRNLGTIPLAPPLASSMTFGKSI